MADLNDTTDRRDQPHYSVLQYIERYGAPLDGGRFAAMRLQGGAKELCDVRTGRMCDSCVDAWTKQFSDLGDTLRRIYFVNNGVPRFLGSVFRGDWVWVTHWRHPGASAGDPLPLVPSYFGQADWVPHDCISLVADWRYWVRDVSIELGIRTHDRGVLAGWHKVELFAILPAFREELYAVRPEWWEHVACCRIWSVRTPPILAYYMNVVIVDHFRASVVWHRTALEFVILHPGIYVIYLRCGARGGGVWLSWSSYGSWRLQCDYSPFERSPTSYRRSQICLFCRLMLFLLCCCLPGVSNLCRNRLVVIKSERMLGSVQICRWSGLSIVCHQGPVAYVNDQGRIFHSSDIRCARRQLGNWWVGRGVIAEAVP